MNDYSPLELAIFGLIMVAFSLVAAASNRPLWLPLFFLILGFVFLGTAVYERTNQIYRRYDDH